MATKIVKEIVTDVGGNVSVEYSDDSTAKFNIADTVTAVTNPLTGGIDLTAGGAPVVVGGGTKVWRGMGQGMSVDIQGYSGGAAYSMTHRTRHYSSVKFRRARAVLQCFHTMGVPLVDTLFTNDYNFQVGFELGYTNATTGLLPRKMFKFSSSDTAQYRQALPPANGYIVSDVLDLGRDVAPQEFFGLWTTVEEATAGTPVAGRIPYTRSTSNFLQRYVGTVSANGLTLAQSQIALNTAAVATSITSATASQGGGSNYFTPVMLLIETDSSLPFIVHLSDSIGYGVGESVPGSGTEGDGIGSALSNRGFIDRAIYENLGYSSVNLGRGSDGNKYLSTPSNWPYRRSLLALANPTHVINANIHNDPGSVTVAGWATATSFAKWDCKTANGNVYVCVVSGTSSAVAGGPTGTGGGIIDGTCVWAYLMPYPALSTARSASIMLAQMAAVNSQIKEVLPNAPIIVMTGTPDAASTDAWRTPENQTVAIGWGDSTSRRNLVNEQIKAKNPLLQISEFFDPSSVLEDGYPTVTGKWVSNGSASYVTNDGTHPNSVGYKIGAATLTADKFI